jgi:hypothetical protein
MDSMVEPGVSILLVLLLMEWISSLSPIDDSASRCCCCQAQWLRAGCVLLACPDEAVWIA